MSLLADSKIKCMCGLVNLSNETRKCSNNLNNFENCRADYRNPRTMNEDASPVISMTVPDKLWQH